MRGNPRRALAFLLAATGVGLCGYAAVQWYQLPRYSEDDLKASTELNLQLDLLREGGSPLSDPAQMDARRQQVRAQIQQEVDNQRRLPLNWLAAGLGLLVLGAAQLLAHRLSGGAKPAPKPQ